MNFKERKNLLEGKQQVHLLRFLDQLNDDEKQILFSQIDAVDWGFEQAFHNDKKKEDTMIEEIDALHLDKIQADSERYRSIGFQAIKEGKKILLEGQLGTLKDPDHGIYPMVTSSSTLAAYGAIGAGIPPYEIKQIVTVSKAYSSSVGAGAFVSEIFGDEADELRRRGGDGGEFGATTGRPRRMGWFDCVASKYGSAGRYRCGIYRTGCTGISG